MARNVAVAVFFFAACLGSGCSQYEPGNEDRVDCASLSAGMAAEAITGRMGKPQNVRRLEGEEIWVYSQPAMPELPMFAADKPVELVLGQGPTGLVLREARCSGIDG